MTGQNILKSMKDVETQFLGCRKTQRERSHLIGHWFSEMALQRSTSDGTRMICNILTGTQGM